MEVVPVVTMILCLVALASVIYPLKFLGLKTRGRSFLIALAAFIVTVFAVNYLADNEAREKGFDDSKAMREAEALGLTTPQALAEHRAVVAEKKKLAEAEKQKVEAAAAEAARVARIKAEKEAKAQAEQEAAEAARVVLEKAAAEEKTQREKDAACRADIKCWGEKATTKSWRCKPIVERMAKYDFAWQDGFLEPAFSHFRWKNKTAGIITVLGDKIKMQNGFGAWQWMIYECDIDPSTGDISDVRVQPGRL